ncbi:acid protease [Thelephora terrestris]|uniref:Acid protease n=1 Tax=Thelephora terrestris TaxID=56493 RepID=A0A9P6H3C6_9AGAM|nr:acid protease [Thelephora terrestris]
MPAQTQGSNQRLNLRDLQTPSTEGPGGADGIVIPLEFVYTKSGSATYILNVTIGENNQQLPLQLDTGSSDLWVASTSCTGCGNVGGGLYDPSGSLATGQSFEIDYIAGNAAGPIVWDKVNIGGYTIDHQALAAANLVQDEPLDVFSGILGLALPLNSVIVSTLSAGDPIGADGATWASNLFGMDGAPAARFLSFLLERPGSPTIPSLLGIGRHPSDYVPDPSKVHYSTIVSGSNGATFWEISVTAVTVYVDGEPRVVNIGSSSSGSGFPTAVLDTGVPVILMRSTIANGIYGALDIHPAQDQNYYVPCKTPLNMTISLNGMAIPLHPLDLTIGQGISSETCVGTIQAADGLLSSSSTADMILGVPFLRNVYTVLAHDVPFANGSFNTQAVNNNQTFMIRPRLGLINLTDPTVALDEFNTVRVLGQPLSSSGNGSKQSTSERASGLSVGLKVLLGLVGVFVLALLVFALRFLWHRRKWKRSPGVLEAGGSPDAQNAYNTSDGAHREGAQSGPEDSSGLAAATMRDSQLDEHMSQKRPQSSYTTDTLLTRVESDNQDYGEEMLVDEFGLVYFGIPGKDKKGRNSTTSRSFSSFPDQATMVGMGIGDPDEARLSQRFGFTAFSPSSPGQPGMEGSNRRRSDQSSAHSRIQSGLNPSEPLLTSQSRSSAGWNDSYFPVADTRPREDADAGWAEEFRTRDSMAGVGAHNRHRSSNGGIDPTRPTSRSRTSSGGQYSPGVPRHSRLRSSFDHTVEDPLLPPSNSPEEGPNRT